MSWRHEGRRERLRLDHVADPQASGRSPRQCPSWKDTSSEPMKPQPPYPGSTCYRESSDGWMSDEVVTLMYESYSSMDVFPTKGMLVIQCHWNTACASPKALSLSIYILLVNIDVILHFYFIWLIHGQLIVSFFDHNWWCWNDVKLEDMMYHCYDPFCTW